MATLPEPAAQMVFPAAAADWQQLQPAIEMKLHGFPDRVEMCDAARRFTGKGRPCEHSAKPIYDSRDIR
jgi:hypothetical protein